jgi:hypothetical protein
VRRAGLEVSSPFELNQVSDMLVFTALGLGVTIMPRTLTGHLRDNAVHCFQLPSPWSCLVAAT